MFPACNKTKILTSVLSGQDACDLPQAIKLKRFNIFGGNILFYEIVQEEMAHYLREPSFLPLNRLIAVFTIKFDFPISFAGNDRDGLFGNFAFLDGISSPSVGGGHFHR
jgi:hypothetical protein